MRFLTCYLSFVVVYVYVRLVLLKINFSHLYFQLRPSFDLITQLNDVIAVFFIKVIVGLQIAFYHEAELIILPYFLELVFLSFILILSPVLIVSFFHFIFIDRFSELVVLTN